MPDALEVAYRERHPILERLANNLSAYVRELMDSQPHVDRISARAKDIDRFLEKAAAETSGVLKYNDPLAQIQDQIGIRIVAFYKSDVERISAHIERYFSAIEFRTVVPDSESKFGYFGRHLIFVLPSDVIESDMDVSLIPNFFELQIKTLFEHAWSEANHDLGYKSGEKPLTGEQERLVAFTSAQAWGADHIFERLFQERSAV